MPPCTSRRKATDRRRRRDRRSSRLPPRPQCRWGGASSATCCRSRRPLPARRCRTSRTGTAGSPRPAGSRTRCCRRCRSRIARTRSRSLLPGVVARLAGDDREVRPDAVGAGVSRRHHVTDLDVHPEVSGVGNAKRASGRDVAVGAEQALAVVPRPASVPPWSLKAVSGPFVMPAA